MCHCGAAFARRDLLTRHQRVTLHSDDSGTETSPADAPEPNQTLSLEQGSAAEADLAAAVSLSGLSVDPRTNLQALQPEIVQQIEDHGRREEYIDTRTYEQSFLSSQLFDGGKTNGCMN